MGFWVFVLVVNVIFLLILAIAYYSEKEMDDAFPVSRRREKARMMREEYRK
jgi:uncharacterized membrane protein